jgi:predicted dehydrogenase
MTVHGVGLIGAGPGVGSLHLPTLARLPEHFSVVHISDGGSGRAAELAGPLHARSSTGIAELLADPAVEIVAICSPPAMHAQQILAAVAAGARAVFCEKPVALSIPEAEEVIEACRAAGTLLLVGTNHLFDSAWGRAKHQLDMLGGPIATIAVTMALPPNGRYHELVSEPESSAPASRGAPDWSDAAVAAGVLRQLVLGLAIHDLPALRDILPQLDEVIFARPIPPVGYEIGARGADTLVHLSAVMLPVGADALWRMSIATSLDRLDVEFPPAFVHAGSARARVRAPDGRLTEYPPDSEDGYVAEWRAVASLLEGGTPVEYDHLLEDAVYAVRLADAVHAVVLKGGAR